ncbi:class I adenylate-forming enzyme family protein [Halobacillus sp. ACCC02827]|uniref:class I adenylate-forming enzyme family protein n=1 Tax=Halobacillus sp. ACCC02827 TaxID=3052090 RepID=UPI00257097DF|nr:class I adenylate-forming enzyme family protein [Halobacillus sp. ACCC02827]WJE16237.1 class I adenylate-forming enzyme family protein [Halobacillus sp. ACCC02827]
MKKQGRDDTVMYKKGKKPLAEYLQDHARQRPNDPAYIYYGKAWNWRDVLEQVQKVAGFLTSAGFTKGDRIGLFMQNGPPYVIAHYAIQYIGAVVCPLSPMYKAGELDYFVEEVGMCAVFAGSELLSEVRKMEHTLARVIAVRNSEYRADAVSEKDSTLQQREVAWRDVLLEGPSLQKPTAVDMDETALLAFTSGTTGRPKAAMLTYGNALYKTAAAVSANGVENRETWLAVMPLCHIAGMVMGVNIPVYTGAPCVLMERFDPVETLRMLKHYEVTVWYSTAPMNEAILDMGTEGTLEHLRLNLCTSFGMPVTESLAERWRELAPGCRLFEASYGLSESHTVDTYMPAEKVKFGSVGVPVPGSRIEIHDPWTGEACPPGESGEIVIRSPGVFKGYWNRPEATAEVRKDDWLHTGDIGYFDEDGYLYFQGRSKEMIKSSGFSIFPEDVESLWKKHPAVVQAAVIGIPDERKGEVVKAFLVLQQEADVTEEELKGWAKEHMARYKVPSAIEIRRSLPQTSAGKILRRLLKTET